MTTSTSSLRPGLTGEAEIMVGTRDTAPHVGSGKIKVLAPVMVGLMEEAALNAVEGLLPPGHQTVGTRLAITHERPRSVRPQRTPDTPAGHYWMRAIFFAIVRSVLLAPLAVCASFAAEPPQDIQRLQREREQQQRELRLRMQQHQERAATSGAGSIEQQSLERDQQQRQQQTHERASREGIGRARDKAVNIDQAREAQAAADEMARLEAERRSAAERALRDRANAPPGP